MKMNSILILTLLIAATASSYAQIGERAMLGKVFLATNSIGGVNAIGASNLPVCTPADYACNTAASLMYVFIGSGNWDVPDNWKNNLVPPATLTANYEIIIDPIGFGECILNVHQTIGANAKLTVLPGKGFRVAAPGLQAQQ